MKRAALPSLALAAAAFATAVAACGGGAVQGAGAPCPTGGTGPGARPTPSGPPTVEEARAFVAEVDQEVRRLWVARDTASWTNQNFITDDTERMAASTEEATAAFFTDAVKRAQRYEGLAGLPEDVARQLHLLKVAQTIPAPSDAKKRSELAALSVGMQSAYGKGKWCPPKLAGKCLTLDDLSRTLRTSRNETELLEAWVGWHQISPPYRDKYARYVELANEGAREVGFADVGAMWRAGYDMAPADLEKDVERLWLDVKPLYDELHCYVRGKLRAKYGKDKVPEKTPIPAHLLGNMWAQEWGNVYDLVEPFKGQPSLDVTKKLEQKKLTPVDMVKLGERFFTSLGFDPLPKSFWERSLFARPKDREVVCHASAWDVTWSDDLRIKMCIEPTEEELVVIHHELGHDYYFHQYYKLPILFQQGANDGFHEGIGDTLALSVTPAYLKGLGLLDEVPKNEKAAINQQMKQALEKVAFLPFGYLIDKWRWDVFSGKIPRDKYNEGWWALRSRIQGVGAPVARTENEFDAGAKFHVPASTPYLRYFLARIYQFQFHRALCKAAGHTGPLDQCSIYGNSAAGGKLRAMLSMGASRPWPEALAALGGEPRGDASALLEYFAPLRAFLKEANKGETCGW